MGYCCQPRGGVMLASLVDVTATCQIPVADAPLYPPTYCRQQKRGAQDEPTPSSGGLAGRYDSDSIGGIDVAVSVEDG